MELICHFYISSAWHATIIIDDASAMMKYMYKIMLSIDFKLVWLNAQFAQPRNWSETISAVNVGWSLARYVNLDRP